jgi:hypothetical protein
MRQAVVTTRLLRQSRTARRTRSLPQPDPTTGRDLAGEGEDQPPSGDLEAVDRRPARPTARSATAASTS